MPRDEGYGMLSSGLDFVVDQDGNLVVVLADVPPKARAAIRVMLLHAFELGIEAVGKEIEQTQAAGAPGMMVALDGTKGD